MTVYPNVKINIGLNVIRKRPDGYHDIETLFVPYFGIHDSLSIEPSAKEEMILIGASWNYREDLSYKAWNLLKRDFDLPPVKITLEKHSPVGAGLGGGSSDAAFMLKAVSELFSLGLSDAELSSYAAFLGSDCPFFVRNEVMFGEGSGEVLSPREDIAAKLKGYEIRIGCNSGIKVGTAEAYKGIVPRELRPQEEYMPLKEALMHPMEEWKDIIFNDFEPTVFALHPEIRDLKAKFYSEGAIYASMSGSGSAVFGIFGK